MLFLATLALLTATQDRLAGDWSYRAVDQRGRLVATGTMFIRPALAFEMRKFGYKNRTHVGRRSVTSTDDQHGPHSEKAHPDYLRKIEAQYPGTFKPGDIPAGDTTVATLNGDRFSADLNAGWSDDNIWLEGIYRNGHIEGVWKWATFAGYRQRGKFTMDPVK